MTPDFVRQHAPNLFIPGDGNAGSAGLAEEQPRYDRVTGMPSPWLREGSGPREYFGDAELRGMQEPDFPMAPAADTISGAAPSIVTGPTNTNPPPGFQGYDELIVPAPARRTDPAPYGPGGITGGLTEDAYVGGGPTERAPQDILRGRGQRGGRVRTPQGPGNVAGYDSPALTGIGRAMQRPQGQTLADMLESVGFQIPNIPSFLSGDRPDRLRGGASYSEEAIDTPPSMGSVQTVSSTTMPDFRTDSGLADFNSRMGLNLRSQYRSQAQQDALRARGVTRARVSAHTSGNAFDVPPREIGGLRGDAAVEEVRTRLQAAGYPPMELRWESGHGRGQGTGPHVHAEPLN